MIFATLDMDFKLCLLNIRKFSFPDKAIATIFREKPYLCNPILRGAA